MNKLEFKEKLLKKIQEIANELGIEKEVFLIEPKGHADLTTNMAMGNKGRDPHILANEIISRLNSKELGLEKIEVAGPGFINFYVDNNFFVKAVNEIIKFGKKYGKGNKKGKINIEFVSANPTGFLHVGHARNAAIGSTIANIVEFAGYDVVREYYINDSGNQINVLANSVWARYQQFFNSKFPMPEEAYNGADIIWCAKQLKKKYNDKFAGKMINKEILEKIKSEAVELFMQKNKNILKKFGVWFDVFFSEKTLYSDNEAKIKEAIRGLDNTFEQDGALWLKTTIHGDDKDRVLIKSDKSYTYFMPDIAYHKNKFERMGKGSIIMNVWGADHSGYIKRMQCAMQDLGQDSDNLIVLCMQLVRLVKNGEEFKMSKRRGTSFFLSEFIKMVGKDSARFLLLDRTYNSKLDFDIDLATNKTNDNPVILIQYANARAYSLLSKSSLNSKKFQAKKITTEFDTKLISTLLEFPEIIEKSAEKYITHLLTQYLVKLAKEFNSWYSNSPKFIGNENEESLMAIAKAVNITLENGMRLLAVSTSHKM
ncbi:arginine--tRNA ligase [Mycoplasma sp. 1331]|uniref:Arginine--tRNA ligase n=1 Tax=Mycoplasma tauri TaxID=547987 RepID=A0A953T798_9MOLU|nr:arginine--tRNA ligase [Mycoplasma tauri]MBZ4195452.1 arginine--tRNA ligase [Mycoplasma tauri]